MNIIEAKDYLKLAAKRGARLGLERVQELVHRLGDPQEQMQVIHIAGTNGKGSVGAMLAAVLHAAGIRTGHFASPALCAVNDYFRIDGETVSDRQLAAVLTDVQTEAEQMADPPTEFEILAAAAYLLFAQTRREIAVVECCMGGGTDCTNVIERPMLSIITNIRKDHCAFLGNTIAEIAAHKAGIIKAGCPVLSGCRNPEAQRVIEAYAKKMGAPLETRQPLVRDAAFTLQNTVMDTEGFGRLFLPLKGMYQPENASLVLQAVGILRRLGIRIPDAAVQDGFLSCKWRGRFELLRESPAVLFDGAHNPDGMRKTTDSLTYYFGAHKDIVFVTGVMADKEYQDYPALLEPLAMEICTVTPDNPRALPAEQLRDVYTAAGIPARAFDTVGDAVRYACGTGKTVVGLGSLYLYPAFCTALDAVRPQKKLLLQFRSQEERQAYTDACCMEMQVCKYPRGTALREIMDFDRMDFWKNDSLYICDIAEFVRVYGNYTVHGIYDNGERGAVDVYGPNYYPPETVTQMIEQIAADKPAEYETMLRFLQEAETQNGFYILGI